MNISKTRLLSRMLKESRGDGGKIQRETERSRTASSSREILPPEPFPIEALGSLMGRAARKVMQASKVADSICGGAFLSTASLCVQGHRNVFIDGRIHPLSEFFLTVRYKRRSEEYSR